MGALFCPSPSSEMYCNAILGFVTFFKGRNGEITSNDIQNEVTLRSMCFKMLWFHINMWLCAHVLTNKELNSNTLSDISKSLLFSAWDCVWFQVLLKLCNHHSLVIFDETWTSSLFICDASFIHSFICVLLIHTRSINL